MFNNIYKNKRILVTGHTGFKGSWLVAWLKMLGANIIGASLAPNTDPAHFSLLGLDIESYLVDVCDADKVKKLIGKAKPEILFHLAAQPIVRESYVDPIGTFATNVMGTVNVLNACRNSESLKAIVVVTSDKCYENKEWIWGYRENDPMGGYDPYSASKGCTELVINSFRNSYFNLEQFGKKHQVLLASARAGNVIGGGDWAKDRLIPDIVKSIVASEKVLIRNPQATRPWQHVLECLSGYLCIGEKLLRGENKFAEGWNFAPTFEGDATVLDVVNKMQNNWSKLQYAIEEQTDHPHEAYLLKLDSSKAYTLLHWRNVWDLEKTIMMTTDWYRNFYEQAIISTYEDIKNYVQEAQSLFLPWSS